VAWQSSAGGVLPLLLGGLALMAACGESAVTTRAASAGGAQQAEAKLQQAADASGTPVYFLGEKFAEWPLTEALTDEPGRVDALYGECRGDGLQGTCGPEIDVINESFDAPKWADAVGCSRLEPVRGVPAVHFGDAVVLLTGGSVVTIAVLGDDTATALRAAKILREVGQDSAAAELPPPPGDVVRLVDAACGKKPGDAGRTEEDLFGPPPDPKRVPDFIVERLGGGQLRWADYAGKPVVVVVGDVPDVVAATRRLASLTSGGTLPAVIGLVWKPFGSKDAPAPIGEIEREAGQLAVPVGYAAIPAPAVWFFDYVQMDPAKTGVIAFVGKDSRVVRVIRSGTGAPDLRPWLDQLR
jgi:hypothetical protein